MQQLVTRHFWLVNLGVLALAAFLLASGTGEMVASEIEALLPAAPPTSARKTAALRHHAAPLVDATRGGDAILERNIFDSVQGPVSRDGASVEGEAVQLTLGDGVVPVVPCAGGQYQLLATIAAGNGSPWSFANLNVAGKPALFRIGDAVGDRTLSNVTWRYAFLRGTSDECFVDLFGGAEPPPAAPKTQLAGKDDLKNAIQEVGANERVVDRALVDKMLADPTKFARSVRVRPHRENGEIVGFKLRSFKPDSPLAMLGAQKNDIIRSVNGIPLTSVDQALSAYTNLRSTDKLNFQVTRNGKPVDLKITVR